MPHACGCVCVCVCVCVCICVCTHAQCTLNTQKDADRDIDMLVGECHAHSLLVLKYLIVGTKISNDMHETPAHPRTSNTGANTRTHSRWSTHPTPLRRDSRLMRPVANKSRLKVIKTAPRTCVCTKLRPCQCDTSTPIKALLRLYQGSIKGVASLAL
jgi:hypothetical protein